MTYLPLVSIIIPVYKVEAYLHECVDSIVNQSYDNIEIILIDDGSPDSCPKICDEYALKDCRIRVIHKSNGGLSDARNAGMKIAKGDFWCFVDSDDVCHQRMIEILMKPLIENKVDISCCSCLSFSDSTMIFPNKTENTTLEILERNKWFTKRFNVVAWSKIYKKELFSDIEYPIGRYHEDVFTTYRICYRANNISYCNSKLYFYRQRNDSIMKITDKKRIIDLKDGTIETLNFFSNKEAEIYSKCLIYYAKVYCGMQNKRNIVYCDNFLEVFSVWKKELNNLPLFTLNFFQKTYFFYLTHCYRFRNFIINIVKSILHRL